MTEAGFAGNQRYLIVTTAVVCVLGGIGAVRVLQGVGWVGAQVVRQRRAPGAITAGAPSSLGLAVASPTSRRRPTTPARVLGGLRHEA